MRRMTFLSMLVAGVALATAAQAGTVTYDVQFTSPGGQAHVIFELPSFQEHVANQATFDLATWNQDPNPPTQFSISGDSTGCAGGGLNYSQGPCMIFDNATTALGLGAPLAPAFSGLGTYNTDIIVSDHHYVTTVTISDTSTAPEPSALVMLSSGLLGVGLAVRKRRFHQRPEA